MKITEMQICSPGQLEDELILHTSFLFSSQDNTNPIILKKITGLEPGEIIRTYNDGPAFFRLRPKERVVSLSLKLNPNYSGEVAIGDLREALYKIVAYNTNASIWNDEVRLELRFLNEDGYIASLFGFVSKVDTDIFSNSSDLTLTLECDDPFLRSTLDIDLSANIMLNSNVSHTYFNNVTYNVESAFSCLDSKSTAPHGFRFKAECISEPPSSESEPPKFIVWDSRNPSYYIFSTTFAFMVGDFVHFSSEEDNRYLKVTRAYEEYNLMNSIYWGSIWPFIYPGENFIEVSEGFNIVEVFHRESYWGV